MVRGLTDALKNGGHVAFYDYRGSTIPDFLLDRPAGTWILFARDAVGLRHGVPGAAGNDIRQYARQDAGRNNAELLFLDGDAVTSVYSVGQFGYARWVLIRATPRSSWLLGGLGLFKQRLLGRLAPAGVVTLPAGPVEHRWLVCKVTKPRYAGPHRYLSPDVGVAGLLEHLASEQARYVVLRWYDELPHLREGGDLDILIADKDLPLARDFLDRRVGTIAVDVYSATGLSGSGVRGMAYYPPALADGMLARAVEGPAGSRIPAPMDALLSFAYHCLYHKGEASGLRSSTPDVRPAAAPEHDYAGTLQAMAAKVGVNVPLDMEGLDEFLAQRGWQPPHDTLAKMSKNNRWVRKRFFAAAESDEPGLAVFAIREQAVTLGYVPDVLRGIEDAGFDILATRTLPNEDRTALARALRGGNWSRGPWPASGGPPAVIVAALDLNPYPPSAMELAEYPRLDNGRLRIKEELRQSINASLPEAQRSNFIHSSDNTEEAWKYAEAGLADSVATLRAEIDDRRRRYASEQPVVETLRRDAHRAKVELVRHNGSTAMRKTYRDVHRPYLQREIYARRHLSRAVLEIPQLIAAGDNYVLCEYEDRNGYSTQGWRLFPLREARAVVQGLRRLQEQGYTLLDAGPDNVTRAPGGAIRFVDFEFLMQYGDPAPLFADGYNGIGPADLRRTPDEDLRATYERLWEPVVGLDLDSLLSQPRWLQYAKRTSYWAGQFAPRRVRRATGEALVRARPSMLATLRRADAGLRRMLVASAAGRGTRGADR